MNYYRLKQIDIDGKFSYSNIVTVRIAGNENKIVVLPNPVKDVAAISIRSEENTMAELQIVDGYGRSVKQFSLQLQVGEQLKTLDIANLSSGTYYIILNTHNGKSISRFVKL